MDGMARPMNNLPVPAGPREKAKERKEAPRPMILSALLHAAALLPLLAAIALIDPQALTALPPVLVTSTCLVYGRLAAFVSGKRGAGEATWMAECLPFAAFACLQGALLDTESCLILLAAMGAMTAGLVSLEDLLFPRYKGFALAFCFCGVLTGLGLILMGLMPSKLADAGRSLAVPAMVGAGGLLLAFVTRYASTRRRK